MSCCIRSDDAIRWQGRTPVPCFMAAQAEVAASLEYKDEGEVEHKEGHRSSKGQLPGDVDGRCDDQDATHGHLETGWPTSAGQDQHLNNKKRESERR